MRRLLGAVLRGVWVIPSAPVVVQAGLWGTRGQPGVARGGGVLNRSRRQQSVQ